MPDASSTSARGSSAIASAWSSSSRFTLTALTNDSAASMRTMRTPSTVSSLGEPFDVAVARGAVDMAEHGAVGHRHPGEHDQHRRHDRDEDAELDAEDERGDEGDAETDQIGPLDRGDVAHLGDVDEADDRHDDDRAERGVGQRREQRREERDRGQHDRRR